MKCLKEATICTNRNPILVHKLYFQVSDYRLELERSEQQWKLTPGNLGNGEQREQQWESKMIQEGSTDGEPNELRKQSDASVAIDETDRLSTLPDDILHYILSPHETMDVIRTSVLSRRWRYIWASMPYLNFDMDNFYDEFQPLDDEGKVFWDFMEWVLIHRNRRCKIRRLQVYFDRPGNKRFPFILLLAAVKNVQELEVTAGYEGDLLNELTFSRNLCKSLKAMKLLSNFNFVLKTKSSFSSLKSVHLKEIVGFEDDTLKELISNTLEDLHLEDCILGDVEFMDISAPNLKKLTFVNRCSSTHYELLQLAFLGDLKICAPKLTYFYYVGPVLRSFALLSLSSLDKAFICFVLQDDLKDNTLNLRSIIRGLHHVKGLTLSAVPLKRFSPTFSCRSWDFDLLPNLKCLKLDVKCTPYHMEGVMYLLKLSPNLQTLVIIFREWFKEEDHRKLLDSNVACLSHNLKVIQIYDFMGSALEMEMVKCLLQYGTMLEKMQIVYKENETKTNFLNILSFARASKNVFISFPEYKAKWLFWSESEFERDKYVED